MMQSQTYSYTTLMLFLTVWTHDMNGAQRIASHRHTASTGKRMQFYMHLQSLRPNKNTNLKFRSCPKKNATIYWSYHLENFTTHDLIPNTVPVGAPLGTASHQELEIKFRDEFRKSFPFLPSLSIYITIEVGHLCGPLFSLVAIRVRAAFLDTTKSLIPRRIEVHHTIITQISKALVSVPV